jgi:hypothetical protein
MDSADHPPVSQVLLERIEEVWDELNIVEQEHLATMARLFAARTSSLSSQAASRSASQDSARWEREDERDG